VRARDLHQHNISRIMSLFIAATKACPTSPAMSKSRNIASRASTSIADEGSGRSVAFYLPLCRIIIANLAKGAARAAGCDTSFCFRTRTMPTEHGVGIVLLLTSAVWRPEPLAKIIRRKLIPSLEHVTWRDPTVMPSRSAISTRPIPSATNSLIFSITCGVNFVRLALAGGLAFVSVMIAPLEVAQATSAACTCSASLFITWFAFSPIKPKHDLGQQRQKEAKQRNHSSPTNARSTIGLK